MTKSQIQKAMGWIRDLGDYPVLEKTGENKGDRVEIFTPKWIVEDMFALMPYDFAVADLTKTIFEPASGDGAFTVYILHTRLMHILSQLYGNSISDWILSERKIESNGNGKKSCKTVITKRNDEIFKEKLLQGKKKIDIIKDDKLQTYKQKSLQALSTIYAIEIVERLNTIQRNNLYSTLLAFAKEYGIELCDTYKQLAKEIIACNIIWGETNIRQKNHKPASADDFAQMSIFDLLSPADKKKVKPKKEDDGFVLGWYMPNKDDSKKIKIAKWQINNDLTYKCKFVKPYPNKDTKEGVK